MKLAHKILDGRLTKHSQALALALGRRVGQPGHDVARDYLLEQMRRTGGMEPFGGGSFELGYELPHPITRKPQTFTNPVGVIPGRDRTLPPILLGAHYDRIMCSLVPSSISLNLNQLPEWMSWRISEGGRIIPNGVPIGGYSPSIRTADILMLARRRKIEPDPPSSRHLRTVRAYGYQQVGLWHCHD